MIRIYTERLTECPARRVFVEFTGGAACVGTVRRIAPKCWRATYASLAVPDGMTEEFSGMLAAQEWLVHLWRKRVEARALAEMSECETMGG